MKRNLSLSFPAMILGVVFLLACAPGSRAENWPHWRGPLLNGSTSETNLPTHWSATENVMWVAPLPGKSGSTPVIWDDSVFVSTPDRDKNLLLLALNAKDGKVRWQKTIAPGDHMSAKNNYTAPTPVTDGKRVIAMYGSGDLVAFDFAGKPLWSRNLAKEYGRFAIMFYYSSCPLLIHDRLYLQFIQRNPPSIYSHAIDNIPTRESFLLCIDPQTGTNLWRQVRETDAKGETMDAYSSPIAYEGNRGTEIIAYGAGFITSHRADTGAELWRCGSLNPNNTGQWRLISSPVAGDDKVFVSIPRRKSPLFAVRTGGTNLVPESQIAWKYMGYNTDVATPLFYQNRLFMLDGDTQNLTCLDPKTGAVKWEGNLGVKEIFTASPTGADGKIYCLSEGGKVVIVSAGDEFKILSSFQLEGTGASSSATTGGVPAVVSADDGAPMISTIAIANSRIYIRGPQNLYCIGKK